MKRYTCDETYFDTIDTEAKAYWLGLIASDGYVTDVRNRLEIGLSGESDRCLLERLKEDIGYTGPIASKQPAYRGSKRHNTLGIASKRLVDALAQHGVVPRKSLILAFNGSLRPDLVRHYARGYFDGDGSASAKRSGDFLLSVTSSLRFVTELADYVQKTLDLHCHIERFAAPKNPQSAALKIGGNFVSLIFLDWLYRDATIYLPRKEAKYRACKELVSARLKPERLHNLLGHPKTMEHAKRCAALLGVELKPDACKGLSVPDSEQREIVRLYSEGHGIKNLQQQRSCSNTLIRNVLTRNGVKLRGNVEQAAAAKALANAA